VIYGDRDYQKKEKNHKQGKEESLVEQPQWTLGEVALSQSTIEQIEEMIAYIKNRDKLLQEWEFNRFLKMGSGLSINFFGPPGTGKSITAEAIANQLKVTLIRVNYGELESSFVGGTSENLSKVFQQAEETESLLFFDEADAVLSRRISNLSQAADHGVNSAKSMLLHLLDKFDGTIIFATNLFKNYDEAFLRRILFNIQFQPPDYDMRLQLWNFHLSKSVPKKVEYDKLAEISEGLCGGDIRNICIRLGLKLLTKKGDSVDEVFVDEIMAQEEIERCNATKNLHKNSGVPCGVPYIRAGS